ncbi:glycoside hydrolase family 2 [Clostridium sp. SYSU_GA19001]|uniref:sugar-binding domain-containing protein n=1 Tax=Clostridium caldaquaticum TaxID=2940653 RepID=UPI002076F7FA|nr:sugar-binding domain-containing protein [Clostridium caldaquaticum]MCM8709903.1 glycoside hydrolase family 2 [Clostridium caldaquaticum]
MKKIIRDLIDGKNDNYILPFLWMRGEEEHIIREEISKIYECGIRGICVEARPHPDFAGPKWWHDLDIVMEEARQRGMKVWVLDDAHFPTGYANGLIEKKYPERRKTYINYNSLDVFAAQSEFTVHITPMLKPKTSFLDFGKKKEVEEQKRNKLISVTAVRMVKNGIVKEEFIDLTGKVEDGFLTCRLPEGVWRIYVVYETKTDGGDNRYINVIDKESVSTQIEAVYEPHYEHYKKDFGKTFAGFFSDETSFGNTVGYDFNESIGKRDMPLPWNEEAKIMMKDELGSEWKSLLPFLWVDTMEMKQCVNTRYTYMNVVTRLYEKNFSGQLGKWCEEHNVEYIGHVVEDNNQHSRLGCGTGHYFRAMSGQHMAGIDVIGGQVIPGGAGMEIMGITKGDGEFYHYALGKLGSSCGHLEPNKKGRTMCELFGAYGWKLGVRDMKYILDHLVVRGINYLVPHAFSMAEYPDVDCPPHFYARGNNPQFKAFAHLMKYANRLCHIFNGGRHIAPAAILYHGESEWTGEYMKMQVPARILTENQIDFDFVSLDMLADLNSYNGSIDNNTLKINGEEFKCLIIPYSQYITKELAIFIKNSKDFNVIFVDDLPQGISNETNEAAASELMNIVRKCRALELEKLAEELKTCGIYDITLKNEFSSLTYYHYYKEGNIYMFQNESAFETFSGEIELSIGKDAVIYYGLDNRFEALEVIEEQGKTSIRLELKPFESCIIFEKADSENMDIESYRSLSERLLEFKEEIDLSSDWKYFLVKSKLYPAFSETKNMHKLIPVSKENPYFAGIIRYEKEIELNSVEDKAYLSFEYVYETMELWINNEYVGMKISCPYIYEISKYLKRGKNTIRVEVATTLDRDKFNHPEPPFILSHDIIDPTGMFGRVNLYL